MNRHLQIVPMVAMWVAVIACVGCDRAPGYPQKSAEVQRPEAVLDFQTLYTSNCAGCHGQNGQNGAALPLNNSAYLAVAGKDALQTTIAKGMSGTLMPPFAKSSGGMLTDQQVAQLAQGILQTWGRPAQFAGVDLPPYANGQSGNIANGQKAFATACARCHGADGMGLKQGDKTSTTTRSSIADPNYLALVSDQTLRSFILGGRPDEAMPDWRTDIDAPSRALTSQEITDIVAWLASHRTPAAAPIPEQHP